MTATSDLESAVSAAAAGVGPSVVRIGRGWGRGAGFVIGANRVLTNAHNLRGHEVTVGFADGHSVVGTVHGVDADGDLAVIEVDTGTTPALPVEASKSSPRLGQAVIAVANPGGLGVRVTVGAVSSLDRSFPGPQGRKISGGIEHTAQLGRGSSGSPIVDTDGALLGINTHRLGDGFYLSISASADLAKRVADLSAGKSPTRARLGVGLAPAEAARKLRRAVGLPERDGVLVRFVETDSPAERAGISRGDLIVRAGGRDVTSTDDLFEALSAAADSPTIEIGIVRGAEELVVTATWTAPGDGAESGEPPDTP
jgi:serine protease Do